MESHNSPLADPILTEFKKVSEENIFYDDKIVNNSETLTSQAMHGNLYALLPK